MPRFSRLLPVLFLFAAGSEAPPAAAWTPDGQRTIAAAAARLAPPDLHRQLTRNRQSYLLGVDEPFRAGEEFRFKNPDGSGALDVALKAAVERAVLAIENHRPFNEIAFRLGVVAHYLAEANNPLATSDDDPAEPRYAADWARYLDSAAPRMKVSFYGYRPGFDGVRDLPVLLREILARGQGLYPRIGHEYRRVGFRSGAEAFNDRSTAYGVASLAVSHAVSDIAEMLRYIWLEAGGIDIRERLPLRGSEIVLLPLEPVRP